MVTASQTKPKSGMTLTRIAEEAALKLIEAINRDSTDD